MKTCKILSAHTFAGLELEIESFVDQDCFDPKQEFGIHVSQDEAFYYACLLFDEDELEDEECDDAPCSEASQEFLLTAEQLREAMNLYLKFKQVTKNK